MINYTFKTVLPIIFPFLCSQTAGTSSGLQLERGALEAQDVLGSDHATVSSALGSSDPSIRKFKDTLSSKGGH